MISSSRMASMATTLSLCLAASLPLSAASSGCALHAEFTSPLQLSEQRLEFTNADGSVVSPLWLRELSCRPCLLVREPAEALASFVAIELECGADMSLVLFQNVKQPNCSLVDSRATEQLLEWLSQDERASRLCNLWLPCFDLSSQVIDEDLFFGLDGLLDNAHLFSPSYTEQQVSLNQQGFQVSSRAESQNLEGKWAPGPELAMTFDKPFCYLLWNRATQQVHALGSVMQLEGRVDPASE